MARLRELPPLTAYRVAIAVIVAGLVPLNLMGIAILLDSPQAGVAPDFRQYGEAVERLLSGHSPYQPLANYRYSPAAVPLLAIFVPFGTWGWSALHLLALLPVRPRLLAVAVAVSWPFWADLIAGNAVTFVFVAAVVALRGSRLGVCSYWALTLLMPRVIQLPLAVYLLWRRRDLWKELLAIFVVHTVAVLAIGFGGEWLTYLASRGLEDTSAVYNVSPAAPLGAAWFLIGLPLAGALAWRGWVGLAGAVAAPYLLAQYLLMLFVDLSRIWRPESDQPSTQLRR